MIKIDRVQNSLISPIIIIIIDQVHLNQEIIININIIKSLVNIIVSTIVEREIKFIKVEVNFLHIKKITESHLMEDIIIEVAIKVVKETLLSLNLL
jgi:hypothetical protein